MASTIAKSSRLARLSGEDYSWACASTVAVLDAAVADLRYFKKESLQTLHDAYADLNNGNARGAAPAVTA